MSEKKPLHVRVAEALGCNVYFVPAEENRPEVNFFVVTGWRCGCTVRNHGLANVHRYDTDWSATGPLIERFGVNLEQAQAARADGSPWAAWRWWQRGDPIASVGVSLPVRFYGETPLEAVCKFIIGMKESGALNV